MALRLPRAGDGTGVASTSIEKLLEANGGCMLAPGCYDALSASVMEKAGHKLAFVSGHAVAATLLGEPDLGILTPPEMARKVGQISYSATGLTVLVDADTGGGSILNVQRTVKQLMSSGAKGAFIEDAEWPKKPGQLRTKSVIPMSEFAGKIAAARMAIGDADFFLVARTDARSCSAKYGLEEAIKRANLYVDAGANASFINFPRSKEELALIGKETKGLRVANMMEGTVTPMCTLDELKEMGFHIVIHPLSGLYAATKALINTYGILAEKGTTKDDLNSLIDFTEMNKMINLEEKLEVDEKLTRREGLPKLSVKVRAQGFAVETDE